MANKEERIATLIRKNLSEIIQFELKNPHLGFLSIPEVKVSKDISFAKIYVSFFFDKDKESGLEILEKSKGFIRSSLAKKMDTRRIPDLIFVLDDGYEKEQRIIDLIKDK